MPPMLDHAIGVVTAMLALALFYQLRNKGVEFSYFEGLLFSSLVIAALFDLWCVYYLLQVDPIAQVGKRERSLIGVLLRQLGLWPIFLAPVAFYFRTKKASPTPEV
jgi:hypothetical protein